MNSLPSSGGLLLIVAVSAFILAIPSFRSLLDRFLFTSPQGLLALVVGVVVILFDDRQIPFIIAVVTAIACYLMVWDKGAHFFAKGVNRLPLFLHIKSISASNFLLAVGGIVYLIAQLSLELYEEHQEDRYIQTESNILVAITLPGQNTTDIMLSSKHPETIATVRREFFIQISKLLHNSFNHLNSKLELLPEAYQASHKDIKHTIQELEGVRDNPGMLISYRKGIGSPIDLVIEPYFSLSSRIGETPRILYKLRIRRIDRDNVNLGVWPDAEQEWVVLDGIQDDHRLAALVGIAKVTVFTASKKLHHGVISKKEYQIIWDNLVKEFHNYYNGFDNSIDQRPDNWMGNTLAKDRQCQGRSCVERWIAAYSEELPDTGAGKNLEKIIRRAGVSVMQSARDGGKM
ncbi:MAG: hypothetical protein KZQ64_15030 [gamma proteobacterium symbiont of Bathyaustriella thionipta]|nr:hypothetical protein [gamma proteobacterium symbiont of Bathyaustriella thionipta]